MITFDRTAFAIRQEQTTIHASQCLQNLGPIGTLHILLDFLITDYRLQITDYRLQITDYRLQITDYRLQITDYRSLTSNNNSQLTIKTVYQ